MSGLFKSTVIKGNRITDFAQTTATVGVPIPKIFGRAPTDGNVIWAPLPPKENRIVKRQGKGGTKTESFTYTLSYAIAFCQGPIYGYWWIKRNGKVVWTQDPNAPVEDAAYAAKWAQKATFYYGTSSQLPDSTIESYEGSGEVSAFRYLAYIVVENDDVTDGGGAVPSYEAVPIASAPEVYFTSHPYPQTFSSESRSGLRPTGGNMRSLVVKSRFTEKGVVGIAPSGGEMKVYIPPYMIEKTTSRFAPSGGNHKLPPLGHFSDKSTSSLAPSGGIIFNPPLGRFYDAAETGLEPTGGELSGTPSPEPEVSGLVLKLGPPRGSAGATSFTDESPLARTINNTGGIVAVLDSLVPYTGVALTGFEDGWQMLYTPHVDEDNMHAGPFQIDFGWMNTTGLYAGGFEHSVLNLMSSTYYLSYEWAVTVCATYVAFYYGTRGANQCVTRFYFPDGTDLANAPYIGQRFAFRIGRDADGDFGVWINGKRCTDYQTSPLSASINFGSITTGTYNNSTDFGAQAFDYLRIGQIFTYVGGTNVRHLDSIEYRVGVCADTAADYELPSYWSATDKSSEAGFLWGRSISTKTAGGDGWASVRGDRPLPAGKWYFEQDTYCNVGVTDAMYGIGKASLPLTNSVGEGGSVGDGYGLYQRYGNLWTGNTSSSVSGSSPWVSAPMNLGFAGDFTDPLDGKLWIREGSTWLGGGDPALGTSPTVSGLTGTFYPMASFYNGSSVYNGLLLTTDEWFTHAAPTGFDDRL